MSFCVTRSLSPTVHQIFRAPPRMLLEGTELPHQIFRAPPRMLLVGTELPQDLSYNRCKSDHNVEVTQQYPVCVHTHSMWHKSWHSSWHVIWHSIWHSKWHITPDPDRVDILPGIVAATQTNTHKHSVHISIYIYMCVCVRRYTWCIHNVIWNINIWHIYIYILAYTCTHTHIYIYIYMCVCVWNPLAFMRARIDHLSYAGGSDRVCGITANEYVHILWWCIGRRPDVYLQKCCDHELLPWGCFRYPGSLMISNPIEQAFGPIGILKASTKSSSNNSSTE